MRGNPDSLSHLLVVLSAPSAPLGKITEWAHRHTERLHKAQYPALLLVIEAKANLLLIQKVGTLVLPDDQRVEERVIALQVMNNALYEAREQEHEARRLQSSLSPRRGPRFSNLSLERFRSSTKYQHRPAAADIAFCVAAFANGMTEDRIGCALKDDYLSGDPSPSKRAAYIRRTIEKARRWAEQ
ncbi:MAG: traI protein helicase [Edaphobacter sp.]|nr:traI protein helicase [Edaphobacter sp.]